MKKQINPTRIGVFVVGAIALTVAAVIVFGSGRFFVQGTNGSTASVRLGLDVGLFDPDLEQHRLDRLATHVDHTRRTDAHRHDVLGAVGIGGEGLEADLQQADSEGRLSGILNGCFYPEDGRRRPGWNVLLEAIAQQPGLAEPAQLAAASQLEFTSDPSMLAQAGTVKAFVVAEINSGQIVYEVERCAEGKAQTRLAGFMGGRILCPDELFPIVEEALR